MGAKLDVKKEDFLKAVKNNRTQAEAIKQLGISAGSFYKYKQEWAKDLATMLTLVEASADGNEDAKEILKASGIDPEPASEVKNKFEEVLNSVDAGSAIHKPNTDELETFFGESATFNPEPPTENKLVDETPTVSVLEVVIKINGLYKERGKINEEIRHLKEALDRVRIAI